MLYILRRLFRASSISRKFEGVFGKTQGRVTLRDPCACMKTKIGISQNDVTSKFVVDEESVEILNCTDFIIHNTKCNSILFTVARVCCGVNLFNFSIQTEFKVLNI